MHPQLDIDPSYQRGKTTEVAHLIRALQAGGAVLDPVTLCRRKWGDAPAEKLWIIDGHQRVLAFRALAKTFIAMVHDSASLEAEKGFFAAMNTRRNLTGDVVVKAWDGESSSLISRTQNEGHPLNGHVAFDKRARDQMSAAALVRGSLTAAEGLMSNGGVQIVLRRLDAALKDASNRARAEHYLRLVGYIYPDGRAPASLVLIAIASVANAHWADGDFDMPTPAKLARLRDIQWDSEVPSITQKFFPVMLNIIRKIWR